MRASACRVYVLGISGGVDSLTAGLLAQRAVTNLRASSYDARFAALRLPYGDQADEVDAQLSLDTIKPDRIVTIDVKPAADAMMAAISKDAGDLLEVDRFHFHLGNVKARQRMIAQYALAGATRGLVIGTAHAAEALMGFYTKFGDGAADILPLSGLNKRRVRALAQHLGAPEQLVFKTPHGRPRERCSVEARRRCLRCNLRRDRRFSGRQGNQTKLAGPHRDDVSCVGTQTRPARCTIGVSARRWQSKGANRYFG